MVGDTAARLGRLGIFADLTEAELHDVAAELDEQSFPEGRWVLRQGETGTGLFIVVDGEVGVVIDDEERATLATGSFFGEVSVLARRAGNGRHRGAAGAALRGHPPAAGRGVPARVSPGDVPHAADRSAAPADRRPAA